MKVLLIATYAGMTGASFSLLGVVKHLTMAGHTVKVVLPAHGKLEEHLQQQNIACQVIRAYPWVETPQNMGTLKKKCFWKIKQWHNAMAEKKIEAMIRQEGFDVVHINAFTAGVGSLAAKRTNTPLVWHIREFVTDDLGKAFWQKDEAMRRLATADRVIAISHSVRQRFEALSPDAHIVTIYNGIDPQPYLQLAPYEIFSRPEVKLMVAGRIVPEKGQRETIEAVAMLRKRGYTQLRLDLVGGYTETEYVRSLRTYIQAEGLEDVVRFCGNSNRMAEAWHSADIAVVSSKFEAFGRVTAEAMMAGALVIGADTAGTKELVGTEYGLLYRQGSAEAMAEQIAYAVDHAEQMRGVAGCAREYALSHFTAQRNAEEIMAVYQQITTEKKAWMSC